MGDPTLLPFFTAGFGALAGSVSAYYFQVHQSRKDERKSRLLAAHEATFAIVRAYDALKDYQARAIAPLAKHPAAWLLPPKQLVSPPETFSRGLEFLLPGDAKLLHQLALESRRYEAAQIAIETHVSYSFNVLQPALEKTGLASGSASEIEAALGVRIAGTAQSNWREVCEHVEMTSTSLLAALDHLTKVLAREFPKEKFVAIKEKSSSSKP